MTTLIVLAVLAAAAYYWATRPTVTPPPDQPLKDWTELPKQMTAQESFDSRWETSDRGNPTLVLDGQRLTVFQQDGGWKWVIADEDDQDDAPLFSDERYKSKGAAQAAGMEELLDLVGG
jgi:hypothetical protein